MQELQLFDLEQYHQPPAQMMEDGEDDYEDPQYITPPLWEKDGGKTRVLRFLHTETMEGSAAICHIAFNTKLPEPRVQGLAATDFLLFRSKPIRKLWVLQLTDIGKAIAKVVVNELPSDAMLLKVKPLGDRITIEYSAYGGMQSMGISLAKEKRRYRQGWASLENRLSRGKYEQFYLHYQLPGQPKRSKYVNKNQVTRVRHLIEQKSPIADILKVISDGKKSL